ncbi:MAG: hypothetical protein HOE48_24005 [Candidatus Latescibacteria bacterium]|nr:hypothetical protein [Candidatus Latescibacterota bacterium]MBT4140994.1 hypothetical protein [Candidatus Latescibacterota bacterium]
MSQKSQTCFGTKSAKPLTEYDSKQEAQQGANHANKMYQQNLVPYQCDKCGQWHLALGNRQTPSKPCHRCTGTDGKFKEAYQSREDAQKRANILQEEQGVTLGVYACEHGNGWHLTKETTPFNKKKRAFK